MTRLRPIPLLLAALIFAPLIAAPAIPQTVSNAFGGLSESSTDPIDIESDVLVVHDKEKYATFKGNVKAVQGTTTLRARELNVHYVGGDRLASGGKTEKGEAAPPTKVAEAQGSGGAAKDEDSKITKIEAKGEVIITSDEDQTTTSDWALYDVLAQLVTVGGNVVLTQGQNVLKGDRLVIDLKTGESRFEHAGDAAAGGRIRALFMPKDAIKGGGAEDEKPGAAKPAAAPAGDKPAAKASEGEEAGGEPSEDAPWPLSPDARP